MPSIRPSNWTFKTSAGYGAGGFYAAGALGHLVLTQPKGGEVVFNYAAAGAGTGASINLTTSAESNRSLLGEIPSVKIKQLSDEKGLMTAQVELLKANDEAFLVISIPTNPERQQHIA